MNDRYLLLWLEAPLQSWGFDSRFNNRESLEFPTRSAITGILLAAMGCAGEQQQLLQQISAYSLTVHAYRKSGAQRLTDFHMVGSGYNEKDSWQTLLIPKTAEGKRAVGGGAKLTYRVYWQDMAFAALWQLPQTDGEQLSQALCRPLFDLFLGRKSCVPSEIIFQGLFNSRQEADNRRAALAEEKGLTADFSVIEGSDPEGNRLTLNDMPLRFGPQKQYTARQVNKIYHRSSDV